MTNCRTDYNAIYKRRAAKKQKRTPPYTVLDLIHELDRYAPTALFLFANGRCVEVDLELVLGLQREQGGVTLPRPSMVLLSVPRTGYGVLTLNPRYKARRKVASR
jgi:hypothetical protein